MTVVQPNSIAGINSITALDDKITFHKSDGSSIGLTFNNTNFSNTTGVSTFANINITGAASTISANGNATFSGIITAANFVGDGTAKFGGIQVNTDAQRLRLKGTGSAGAVESIALQLNTNAEGATTQHALLADQNSSVKIYNSGNEKLRTTGFGVTIFGTTRTQTLNVSGVSTSGGNVTISSGAIDLKNSGSVSNIKFYCESANAHYTALQSAAHSAYGGNVTITLPTTTDTLVARTTTDTLTNKTLTSPTLTTPVFSGAATGELKVGSGITIAATSGVATFADGSSTANALKFGSGGDFGLYHSGAQAVINNSTGNLSLQSSGNIWIENQAGSKVYIKALADAATEIYYNNSKKFETTNDGTVTTGIGTFTGLDVADKITHTGDANTAIRFPGNDQITFETNASERLRIAAGTAGTCLLSVSYTHLTLPTIYSV